MGAGAEGRVLYLEDDRQYAELKTDRLAAESDCSVATEQTPEGVLERLEAEEFHCFLSNYGLPNADGLAVVQRVRDVHPDLPVVLLVRGESEVVASEVLSAGVTDYVRTAGDSERVDVLANRVENAVETYMTDQRLREERRRNDEFVRLVAHDLRNPMAVARGWMKVLNDDGGEIPYQKAVDALNRMDELVENLESLARSGETDDCDDRIELSSVATAAWELVATGGANLHVEYGPQMRADASMLQQILENLFTNAVEHGSPSPRHAEDSTADGGETVTVRVGTTSDGFYVADDGEGIDPAEREQIFESGYTANGGTGLGLAIVDRIATAHGWDVTVGESEHGGARFDFTGVTLELPQELFR